MGNDTGNNRIERQRALMQQLIAAAERSADAGSGQDDFVEFVRQCVDFAPLETLQARDIDSLISVAQGLYAASQQFDGFAVEIEPPRDASGFATLRTVCVDRPFLVDSISMAVREAGAGIDWLIHPVMRAERDDAGARSRVVPRDDSGGREESYVHLTFDPLSGPKAYDALAARVRRVLADLAAVVEDYVPMRRRVQSIIAELKYPGPGCDRAQFAEARAFLEWLDDGHFTYLGFRATRLQDGDESLEIVPDSGLGLLRDERTRELDAPYVAPPAEMSKYVNSSRLVVITKSAARSHLHHPDYMDSISIKHYDESGHVIGTYRFLGLFASNVYASSAGAIPIVRTKLDYVVRRTRLPTDSHAAKALRDVIESLPRDELFQSGEEELFEMALAIRALSDRQQLKLLMRRDRYGRFYSCLVYLPRDRYGWQVRERMAQVLTTVFDARGIERNVEFMRNGFARIHFFVRTEPGTTANVDAETVEARLLAATRTWADDLREALVRRHSPAQVGPLYARYADAFGAGYMASVNAADAVDDIDALEALDCEGAWQPRLVTGASPVLKLYISGEPDDLSDVLPTLEAFGLAVSSQRPYKVTPNGQTVWIQEFECAALPGQADDAAARRLESALIAVRNGAAENDGLNRLVFTGALDWRRIALVRTWLRYLVQTGMPYSPGYMAEIMSAHGELMAALVALFERRFDPAGEASRADDVAAASDEIASLLEAVEGLDADRLLRGCAAIVDATLRTNYFQRDASGEPKPWISLKLRSSAIIELPPPLPHIETFVYSPDVEGIHLRGGPVARGGLRWSDRREDFRTEVLGLMKAQMVKNAVIVPVGAKGGFVVKRRTPPGDRDALREAGVACYKTFIRGLLDITDNRVGEAIVPPTDVVRADGDDPYLVVAADKGTASFSDIANGVAAEYDYWLGDAFASGGAAGYDHKVMGITARSAWESVKRHFREMGRDTQSQPFTVIGIGDMSGDVFGNGMLLSDQIRLIGAFNHLHIFIDPDPDPATSFAERQRLFALPRSSWADYDTAAISGGGGVFDRTAKRITLTDAMRRALDTDAESLRPSELIRAMITAPVDLLWNGGIGTYVKAHDEAHAEVGDRANEALRVDARTLRCKVIGEGGNLGMTQRGRVAYALAGGRLNTDAIDNVGGVASSDREVNIKIPFNALLQSGALDEGTRNQLLEAATEDVAALVLDDAYRQGRAISVMQQDAAARLDEHANLMRMLERSGLLDRAIEALPSDDELADRRTRRLGLTRPELAVLLSYSKIALYQALLDSDLPDDPSLESILVAYFPASLMAAQSDALRSHRLRRELIATEVTNLLVDTMGVSFAHRQASEQGIAIPEVARAFLIAMRVLDGGQYFDAIEALDGQMPADVQYALMARVAGLIKHACNVFLTEPGDAVPLDERVAGYREDVSAIAEQLPDLLPQGYRADWDAAAQSWRERGVPDALAGRIANTRVLGPALDISALRQSTGRPLDVVAATFFHVGEALDVLWLHRAINALNVRGRWPALARSTLRDDAFRLHGLITGHVLREDGDDPVALFKAWSQRHATAVEFAQQRLREIREAETVDFMVLSVAVRELRTLRLIG